MSCALPTAADLYEQTRYAPDIAVRIQEFVRMRRARGDNEATARLAYYPVTAAGTTSASTYTRQLPRQEGPFAIVSIEHPSAGNADILAVSMRCGGNQYIDSDVLCDAWCDAEGTEEDPRSLPAPVIVGTGDTWALDATGSSNLATSIQIGGYHVDETTAEVLRQAGELSLEGINKTFSAAAIMADTLQRTFRTQKIITHLVSKQALTGDGTLANVAITLKGVRITPLEGATIPPRSTRKARSRLDAGVSPNDTFQMALRYTSAGGAGTAKLQTTLIGRRRYRAS